MTPTVLIKELAAELRRQTAQMKFSAEGQSDKRVSVYEGYMPQENYRVDSYLPMIVVELRQVVDTESGSFVDIGLMMAVYGGSARKDATGRDLPTGFKDYGDGWRDLHNLAEVVRQGLLTLPSRVLAEKFRLEMPIVYQPQSNQPIPFYYGDMITTWEVGQPIFHF